MSIFTVTEQKALAIGPKIPAALSILGSSALCYLIIRDLIKDRGSSMSSSRLSAACPITKAISSHLILGMGLSNLFASSACFFTTWPIPRDLATQSSFASGTQQTCSTQGFFIQLGSMTAAMYNTALALFYFLIINRKFIGSQLAKVEPFLHMNAILWGLGTSIACLALTLFNDTGWSCWIRASPLDCKESWTLGDGSTTTCHRGDNATIYKIALYYGPIWAVIIIVSFLMFSVYIKIRNQDRRMNQFGNGTNRSNLKNAKKFARQATLFVGVFYVTWLFPTIYNLVLLFGGPIYFSLLLLNALSLPVQGFLNFIVFINPRHLRYKKKHPDITFFPQSWLYMLWEELLGESDSGSGTDSSAPVASEPKISEPLHSLKPVEP